MIRQFILSLVFVLMLVVSAFSQAGYFYPNAGTMNPYIPSPEKFLGYAIGTHHTRHDKLVEYFKELDRLSDRVTVQAIGETYEHRQQVLNTDNQLFHTKRLADIIITAQ